jgi:hypothetical protein
VRCSKALWRCSASPVGAVLLLTMSSTPESHSTLSRAHFGGEAGRVVGHHSGLGSNEVTLLAADLILTRQILLIKHLFLPPLF